MPMPAKPRLKLLFLLPAVVMAGTYSLAEEAWLQPSGSHTARAVLTSYQESPEMCGWPAPDTTAGAAFQAGTEALAAGQKTLQIAPARVIRDRFPSFSAITLDLMRNEVAVTDENLQQLIFYRRTEDNAPDKVAEPVRVIGTGVNSPADKRGSKTNIEFQAGIYLDTRNGELYAVNNDSHDTMVIFSREAAGNVAPQSELTIPHGAFGIAIDEANQELFLSVQHDSGIVVYRKGARGEEAPIRLLQGPRTRLANPHGIALDPKTNLMFVANHGSVALRNRDVGDWLDGHAPANWPLDRGFAVPGSGKTFPPSIIVYSRTAAGDSPPVRSIEGPHTLLNWPTGVAMDSERGEIYVANNAGESILVFDAAASGDVAPRRVLAGSKTTLKNPTSVALDPRNRELWVTNFGNHTATVYPIDASGNVAPLRTIRGAPAGTASQMIGNPGGVAFDTRREEILVPN